MSTSGRERLIHDLQQSSELFREFRDLSQDLNQLLQWTREKGYLLTRDDLVQLLDSDRELSDDELEQAAGGDWGDGTGGGTGGTTGGGGG